MKANVKVPSPLEELDNYMKEEYDAIKKADRIIGGHPPGPAGSHCGGNH